MLFKIIAIIYIIGIFALAGAWDYQNQVQESGFPLQQHNMSIDIL